MRLSGLYALCVRYVGDDTFYMIPFEIKKEKGKVHYKNNLESIDTFTTAFTDMESLKKDILAKLEKDKQIQDVCIMYKHNKEIKKADIIINDNIFRTICLDYIEDKYEKENKKALLRGTNPEIIRIINRLIRLTENDKTFKKYINNSDYLFMNMKYIYEKLLKYKEEFSNNDKANIQTYCVIENTILSDYTIFRKLYIWLNHIEKIEKFNVEKEKLTKLKETLNSNDEELLKLSMDAFHLGLTDEETDEIVIKRKLEKE